MKLFRSVKALLGRLRGDKKGAALAEYAILLAGIALISLAAVSILGHKISDMVAAVAVVLPGAHTDDNAPIQSGHLVETTSDGKGGPISLDTAKIQANSGKQRLGDNIGVDYSKLILEAP